MNLNLQAVKDRLFLFDTISEAEHLFQKPEQKLNPTPQTWDHKYKHYLALQYYLLLTCFDMLGQTREFIQFNSWLESKKKNHIDERELIINKLDSQTDIINQILKAKKWIIYLD